MLSRKLFLAILCAGVAFGQRGVSVGAAPVRSLPSADKRYALVVGVDDYEDANITKLQGASNDANRLKDVLVRYAGFPEDNVIVMTTGGPRERRPTRSAIIQRLSAVVSQVPKDGLFLFAFSGHGMERQSQAFLLPSDAALSDDPKVLEQLAVSVRYIRDSIADRGIQQVIVLLDACRNDPGGRADAPNPMSEGFRKDFRFDARNRNVEAFATIYATSVGDRAFEYQEQKRGYFSWALEEALSGRAANGKGEVTLGRLVAYLQDRVPKQVALDLGSRGKQRPFADISGFQADDLVLSVTTPGASVSASTESAEIAYWSSIKDSTDASDFKAYVARYPQGQFVELANLRIQRYGKPAAQEARAVAPASSTVPIAGGITAEQVPALAKMYQPQMPPALSQNQMVELMSGKYSATQVPSDFTPEQTEALKSGKYDGYLRAAEYRKSAMASVANMPEDKCARGCSAKIGDFPLVARYSHAYPQDASMSCDEKVFRMPDTWPGGPFLHAYYCKERARANGTFRSLVGVRLAKTDREYDQDTVITFNGGAGQGAIFNYLEGRVWHGPWTVKVFGTGTVESMDIEVAKTQ